MKKSFLLILLISSAVFLTALFFIVKSLDSNDLSEKIDYFRNSFKEDETYFNECPKDSELSKLFAEHKNDFKKLQIMASEDAISSFQKQYVFHKNGSMFFPYVMGEFPGDKKITRDRFFKYLHLMQLCKVKSISTIEYEEEENSHPDSEAPEAKDKDKDSDKTNTKAKPQPDATARKVREDDEQIKGYSFELYYGYDAKDKTLKDWITTHKNIYYWSSDDNIKVVADTDKTQVSTPGESLVQQFRLEPHWFIRKYTYMDNPEDSKSEDTEDESKDEDTESESTIETSESEK